MVRNPLEDCLTGRCPSCGSENISCTSGREDSEAYRGLPLGEFVKKLLKAKVVLCVCRDCGYRWECRIDPFTLY